MISATIEQELHKELDQLPADKQQKVLEYARSLSGRPRGVPGKELLRFAGAISPEDLAEMSRAIEEGCEQVEPDGW